MKYVLICFLFISCNVSADKTAINDSMMVASDLRTESEIKDSLVTKINNDVVSGFIERAKESPVAITSSRVVKKDYGAKEVHFTLKNNSSKTVDAVRFGYSLLNNFGDNLSDQMGVGFEWSASQEIIKPNKTVELSASIFNSATKVRNTFVNEVHYTDGSKWEAPK